jgi:CHAD domain-containing protein
MPQAPTLPELIAPAIHTLTSRIEQAASRVATMSDDEAIHDFRVAIRRLRSILATTRSLYEPKRIKALNKQIKRFADGCGALRDEEVLSETLARVVLDDTTRDQLSRWLDSRKSHQSEMNREAAQLAGSTDLHECLTAITRATTPEASRATVTLTLGSFCRKQLDKATARVESLLPAETSDSEGLHRLRIAFKRQRYTAERRNHRRALRQSHAAAARHRARYRSSPADARGRQGHRRDSPRASHFRLGRTSPDSCRGLRRRHQRSDGANASGPRGRADSLTGLSCLKR